MLHIIQRDGKYGRRNKKHGGWNRRSNIYLIGVLEGERQYSKR